ncbi:MFS family permease [Bradyrhizobium sp. USDA 4461]
MSVTTSQIPVAEPSVAATLFPIVAVIFSGFLVIGLAMPALPLHVHQGLGFDTFVVGLVAGSQFAASLISRFTAGHLADTRGVKRVVVAGLIAAAVAGLLYGLSLEFVDMPALSLAILLLGRAILGGAESFMVAGALNWGLALAGPANTGRVMSWVGTAIYVAYAAGAPAGSALYARHGFAAIAFATMLIPLLTLCVVAPLRGIAPSRHARPALTKVLGAIWLPGLGMALSSVGFGAITTFVVLLFARNGWSAAWLALSLVSLGFVIGRLIFGHLPDRIGGPLVALVCILIEAAGQALIWLAAMPVLVFAGAALAGLGYSLVYPGFGVEAVRRAPPESRGLAMGAYTACLDLTLGVTTPLLGLIAGAAGLNAVFLTSTLVVLSGAVIALWLIRTAGPSHRSLP